MRTILLACVTEKDADDIATFMLDKLGIGTVNYRKMNPDGFYRYVVEFRGVFMTSIAILDALYQNSMDTMIDSIMIM